MFSSPVTYEGLDSFLKSDKTGVSTFRNGNSSDDSQPDPAYGYATANSSPILETRIRSRSYPSKQRALVSKDLPKDCPAYEGVSALSSFGRPLSKLSNNTNVTSLINTLDHKMHGYQHYEMGICSFSFLCDNFCIRGIQKWCEVFKLAVAHQGLE